MKQGLQALAKAADNDGDGQASGDDAQRFADLLNRLATAWW